MPGRGVCLVRRAVLVLAALALFGCNLVLLPDGRQPVPVTATPTLSPVPVANGWEPVSPGVEFRRLGSDPEAFLVRLDPAVVTFRVHYSPGDPHSLNEWRTLLPQAWIIINAAFFDEEDQALGLLVSDGQAYGQSFSGFGGMFQVDAAGGVRVRSLVTEPYQGEWLGQAVQAFPMLIEVGGVLAPSGEGFDVPSRRTFVAQDRAGRIILAVIPHDLISLADLQQWLYQSDLDLYIAFGLDGGRSTAMGLYSPAGDRLYPALDQLPSVIAVYPR